MHVAQETLGLRRPGLSPGLALLMSAFALPIPPARVTPHLHRPTERSPTASAVSYPLSAISKTRAYLAQQTLQHAGDRDILLPPARGHRLFHIAEIRAVPTPHLHFVTGAQRHGEKAFELHLRLRALGIAFRHIDADR